MEESPTIQRGLEDVIVAETRLSSVDGENGELIIAGEEVGRLADRLGYEPLVARLLHRAHADEVAGDATDQEVLNERLGEARTRMYDLLEAAPQVAGQIASLDAPMAALRAGLGLVAGEEKDSVDAATVIGAVPVINAAWWHRRRGTSMPAPDPTASHVADYLRMVTGSEPSEAYVEALEKYMMSVADHGMNASTFTARVITSTGSDLVSAVVGAVGALKGPLHGGAPGPVLDMLDAIEEAESAEAWIRSRLDEGERIMGMGHRVYQVRDPRARVFEKAVERLRESTGDEATLARLTLARRVEETAEAVLGEAYPDRSLRANVEFYTAVLLEAVGMPRALFTNTFAAGRAAGWSAHVIEQRRTGRLIRPRSVYRD
jgi:citrate synthase